MKQRAPLILSIDTSCDDTSAAVTAGRVVLSNVIASQAQLHTPYGGVFPTVAKQAHRENIAAVLRLALKRAGASWSDLHAVAVTQGPGLAPALEVGIATAQAVAKEHNLPLVPINHLEGHLLSPLATPNSRVLRSTSTAKHQAQLPTANHPVLGIIVSGGHTQFVHISQIGEYALLGETIDDAAGECLDKIGRMLNLGYPAGPVVEEFAQFGNARAVQFPLPMTTSKDYNLSFSGLKTFARNTLEVRSGASSLSKQELYDFCASAQYAVFRHITHKLSKILDAAFGTTQPNQVSGKKAHTQSTQQLYSELWLGGGVAANITLRKMIRDTVRDWWKSERAQHKGVGATMPKLRTPYSVRLCMDNAAMIGIAAGYRLEKYRTQEQAHPREIERKPRWQLS